MASSADVFFDPRNLHLLPQDIQTTADCALRGSIAHLERMVAFAKRNASNADLTELLLPICWANLDTSVIPKEADLNTTVPYTLPRAPLLALSLSCHIHYKRPEAGADLWTRVWPWACFIDEMRDIVVGCPSALDMARLVFTSMPTDPEVIVNLLPAFRIYLMKAWNSFLQSQDPDTPGFWPLVLFLSPGEDDPSRPSFLAEYVQGAGGSVHHLARLVYEHVALACRTGNDPHLIAGLNFVLSIPISFDNGFHEALGDRGIVRILCRLANMLTPGSGAVPPLLLVLMVLRRLLGPDRRVRQALRHHLLDALLRLATLNISDDNVEILRAILARVQLGTLSYSVLSVLQGVLSSAEDFAASQTLRHLHNQWNQFISSTYARLAVKNIIDSPEYVPHSACDYIRCRKIQQKKDLKACGDCRSARYCNIQCQRSDWCFHRLHCETLQGEQRETLRGRERSFVRAIVKRTYETNQTDILVGMLTEAGPKNLDQPMSLIHDYRTTTDRATLKFSIDGPGSFYQVQRAQRDRKIHTHLVYIPGHNTCQLLMRSETDLTDILTTVHKIMDEEEIAARDALTRFRSVVIH
ncbi:hypothetical protein B0H16DRAFT_1548624 [Mycena metata]|uniref:MYND-type domain-containing protein n=1 Tax=Mycena metata TaxID=1033252 RepID=A0AAD7N952_9AGAR|nr:hypothetical protein B0H16DRAFT_1548624 [Mycena metata]